MICILNFQLSGGGVIMSVMITRILLSLSLLFAWAHAESVKSITGNIIFDINNDGTSEARMTSDGLEVQNGIDINGSHTVNYQTVSSDTTLSGNSIVLINTTSGNVNITLPYAGNVDGRLYKIKKISALNNIVLSSDNLIDTSSSHIFTSGNTTGIEVISNGSQWYILSKTDSGINSNDWSPSLISTLAWFDASDTSTVLAGGSDNVYQWNDKSGNAKHATQTTSGDQPTYTSATYIEGTNTKHLDLPSNIYSDGSHSQGTLVFVGTQSGSGGGWGIYGNQAGTHTPWTNLSFYDSFLSTSRPLVGTTGGSIQNNQVLITYTQNGGTLEVFLDGDSQGSTSVSFTNSPALYQLFGSQANYKLNEIIFLPNDTDKQKVEGYLAHKWGIEANLVSGHPYKDSPP